MQTPHSVDYAVDTRPLCSGMPFVLTDVAHPRLVLKSGSHFLVLDESASIPACNTLGYGYYRFDTRYLSQWEMTLDDIPLSLLSCDTYKGYSASFVYTNAQTGDVPQQKLKVYRQLVLDDILFERLSFENFGARAVSMVLKVKFQADFADMFEVRGWNRELRGQRMMPVSTADRKALFLAYRGLDGCLYETAIEFLGRCPDSIADGELSFELTLPVRQEVALELRIITRCEGQAVSGEPHNGSLSQAEESANAEFDRWRESATIVETDHELVNRSLHRGLRDLYILRQPSPKGFGLAAGIPWYSAIFGRDNAIAGWQILPYHPALAKECLSVLAAYQGGIHEAFREEEPGRIMHELRLGELARMGLIPHSPYYGTIDATQLWLMLLCRYLQWTADIDFITEQWPAVERALNWIDEELVRGNGYLAYARSSPCGLDNQGWKDSFDAIMHQDGTLAQPPIAVCEAQAYLYAAWSSIAELAELLGHKALSGKLISQAEQLKERFERDFWMDEDKYVALALDGSGRQVKVVSSNPGHCLWTGILNDEKANCVADRLMSDELHSGWGIRTLSDRVIAYNPLSYHNGSVWPHENAIIAEGLRRLGRLSDVHRLLRGILEAGHHQPGYRLPELFCGFERGNANKPIDYPVSCSPQAWAAGAIFQMISACINFQPDALNNRIRIVEPFLPEWFGTMKIRGLKVGDASIDIAFDSSGNRTFCQILQKTGRVKVVIEN